MPSEGKTATITEMKVSLRAGPQIAPGQQPFEGGKGTRCSALTCCACRHDQALELVDRGLDGQRFAFAGVAVLDLDLTIGNRTRPDDHLPWQADQVHRGEFRTGTLVRVVVQHVQTRAPQALP